MTVRKNIFAVLLIAVLIAPAAAHASLDPEDPLNAGFWDAPSGGGSGGGVTTIGILLARSAAILNTVIPFLIGLAVFIILWGILRYISHGDEEERREEGKQFVVWGIVGVFLMFSVWGLVAILDNSFNLNKSAPPRSAMPSLPAIPGVAPWP